MNTEVLDRGTKFATGDMVGVVITVLPREAGKGEEALVEYDGKVRLARCLTEGIEVVGRIESSANPSKCAGCGFFQMGGCVRYSSTRTMASIGGETSWPTRIYPICKAEMSGVRLNPLAEQAALMFGNEVEYRGRKGVIIEDVCGICDHGEVLVMFDRANKPAKLNVREILNPVPVA